MRRAGFAEGCHRLLKHSPRGRAKSFRSFLYRQIERSVNEIRDVDDLFTAVGQGSLNYCDAARKNAGISALQYRMRRNTAGSDGADEGIEIQMGESVASVIRDRKRKPRRFAEAVKSTRARDALVDGRKRVLGIGLGGIGLQGLGVPYAVDVAIWVLAVGSIVTVIQRIVMACPRATVERAMKQLEQAVRSL